jgi:hypothetical protein
MRLDRDILIPSVDLMINIVVIFLIGIVSIRFVSDKGIDKSAFFPVKTAIPNNLFYQINQFNFNAIVLEHQNIKLVKIEGNEVKNEENILSIEELKSKIENDEIYVIYEQNPNIMLGNILKIIISKNSSVFLTMKN